MADLTRRLDPAWISVVEPAVRDGRVVRTDSEPARRPRTRPLPGDLPAELLDGLRLAGIERLYSHQTEVRERAAEGDVIVTTGTASGKSLAFNLPVLSDIATDPGARALYLYPTKALAQDQARKLSELRPPGLRPAVYDGDTPREERRAIRDEANALLTNPDMLSVGILPHHDRWRAFFSGLRWVVVDEAHTYRGVFGSHVANVLRRLRRVARIAGSDPRFVLASATIANPGELAEALTGRPAAVVSADAAPGAERRIAMWNPPLIDEAAGVRRSVLAEAADLLADLVRQDVRTIAFMKSRKGVELILRLARERLELAGRRELAATIAPYRAGYTPAQRREIEGGLVDGSLRAVIATDALELGIDIGHLDAAICVTFPGTVASLRQMWGRAGRRDEGLCIYVAGEDGLDQFFCRHPDEFLGRPVEAAILDPANEHIRAPHLAAAAYEAPLEPGDENELGEGALELAGELAGAGELRRGRGGRLVVPGAGFPAGSISLRSASAEQVAVVELDSGEVIGSVEGARALSVLHPGAVYLHLGRSYEVHGLDLDQGRAAVEAFEGEWYTQPKKETSVWIESIEEQRDALGVALHIGEVAVSEHVLAYQRRRLSDHEVIGTHAVELPEQSYVTQALWYELDDEALGEIPAEILLGALHASEHCQIAVLPLLAMCDRWDIGGLSTSVHPQTGRPTIFIHEGHPGGVGIARRGYEAFERLVEDAARLVGECGCEEGCPSCVQSPKCGNLNEHLHKGGAIELMGRMRATGAAPAARS